MPKPKVFISYAHRDEPEFPGRDDVKWLSYVKGHLAPLSDAADVEFWADTDLLGSQDWEKRIFAAIDACDIFILCVSANSLGSTFITKKEVPRILERQQQNGSSETPAFYPILITPCGGLRTFDWLRAPNMRPKDRKALSEFERTGGKNERDTVMAGIVDELVKLAKQIESITTPLSETQPRVGTPVLPAIPLTPERRIVDGYLDMPSQAANRVVLDIGFIERAVTTIKPRGRGEVRVVFGVQAATMTTTISSGRITEFRTGFAQGYRPPRTSVIVQPSAGRTIRHFDIRSCDGGTLSGNPLLDTGEHGAIELFSIEGATPDLTISAQVKLDISGLQVEEEDQVCLSAADQAARASQLRALAQLVLKKHGSTYELGGVS